MYDLSAYEKGNALERTVSAIEGAIIRAFPGYSERKFRIEGRKIVVVADVRHEIDVYVSVNLGGGYDAVFIFECKNWQDKVGKNEVIILSEKVRAIGAQRGFFVARSYTADAIAQAALDPRLELLTAVELDPSTVVVPAGFHLVQMGETRTNVLLRGRGAEHDERVPIDMESIVLELEGDAKCLMEYVQAWTEAVRDQRVKSFPSLTLDGEYLLEFSDTRKFSEGQAKVDGKTIDAIDLEGTVKVQVIRATVVSAFEVTSRGRVISVQIVGDELQLKSEFIQVNAGLTA